MSARTILGFAAVTALTAASAFGSDRLAKAKIGFGFRAGSTSFPAGDYLFESPQGRAHPMLVIRNTETGQTRLMLMPIALPPSAVNAVNEQPRIDFLCAGTECALYRVWPSNYSGGWSVSRPKFKDQLGRAIAPGELRLATVYLPVAKAD